jgi:hypothetical protein
MPTARPVRPPALSRDGSPCIRGPSSQANNFVWAGAGPAKPSGTCITPRGAQPASPASFVTVFQLREVPGGPSSVSHFQEASGVPEIPSGSHR